MLPLQPPSLVKMQSMHFWIKTDHSTSVLVSVSEKDGGRYKTVFTCSANTWQEVSIGLSDFTLSEDGGDPKDPDGKLDPDQIEGVAIVDTDSFIVQMLGDMPAIVNLATGAHSLYVNSFTIDDTPVVAVSPAVHGETSLMSLLRPQTDWMVIGDVSVQKATEKPLTGASMKIVYTQTKGKFFAMMKPVKVGSFAGVTEIDFSAASMIPLSLMVQIEDTNGNKFNTVVMLPGESQANDYTLNRADFAPAQDSKDPGAKLELPLIKQVVIMDVTGFGDIQDKANSLWLNKLRTVSK